MFRQSKAPWTRILFAMLLVFLMPANITPTFSQSEGPTVPVDPQVLIEMADKGETTFWVILQQKADLGPASLISDWSDRGRFVYNGLRAVADSSQADLRSILQKHGVAFTPFWIVNAIRVTGNSVILDELAQRPEVERISASTTLILPEPVQGIERNKVNAVEWNIERIRAPEVWSTFGVQGEGIVVANIDTGVQYGHAAIVTQYRGNLGGGIFDHNYNWFDPSAICPPGTPCDNNGHGTHTMGTMVGDDGGANQIGVAPAAQWIAAKGCEMDYCSDFALLSSAEWILAPCALGDFPNDPSCDPDQRPHIVNNSWGGYGGSLWFQGMLQAWVAAGIFPVFANGNAGPSCETADSPGDNPESYAAGAFDINNAIAAFSSRGASYVDGGVKPDIAAPGVDVRSSVPYSSGYESHSGTSMAAPHVAGSVALMWSAAPVLVGDIDETRSILDRTAIDTENLTCGGTPGNNNVWGEGRLDALAAVDQAPRSPFGTLQGTVTEAVSGLPLAGAGLRFTGPYTRTTRTDANGLYHSLIPVGVYEVTASQFGYMHQTEAGVVVSEGATTIQDFALQPLPAHPVSGYVFDNYGLPLANAQVTILATPIPPVITDASGFFRFPSVPEGTYEMRAEAGRCNEPLVQPLVVAGAIDDLTLTLPRRLDAYGYHCSIETAGYIEANTVQPPANNSTIQIELPFPFSLYEQTYHTVYVSIYGYLSFLNSLGSYFYYNSSIPSAWEPNGAIYPFWDDLVFDDAASVRTELLGEAPNRAFVIEWRDMAFCCTSTERVRFEVVLYENSQFLLQYTSIDADAREQGSSATIGIENESGTIAFQYASDEAVIFEGLAIRFRPPPFGFVQGTVTDAITGLPVADASVQIAGPLNRTAFTDANGFYSGLALAGTYDLTASRFGYRSQAATGVVVSDGETTTQDFVLQPLPAYAVSGYVSDDRGNPLAYAQVKILATPLPPVFTDARGFFQFERVPEGEYQVFAEAGRCMEGSAQPVVVAGPVANLKFALYQRVDAYSYHCAIEPMNFIDAQTILPLWGDEQVVPVDLPFPFPFYGQTYQSAYVSTNGLLNFLGPNAYAYGGLIPSPDLPNAAIYAFWDDLVVDEAASVRTELLGEAPNRLFVIEWRDVTFWSGSSGRVRFEVVLHENGQILLQYTGIDADLREQGSSATIGIENASGEIAFQYAADEAVISEGLAIRFQPLASAILQGTLTDANTGLPLVGADVQAFGLTGHFTRTDPYGLYSFWLLAGTYDLTASRFGYMSQTAAGVVVSEGATTIRDFALQALPAHPVSGYVFDSHGNPLPKAQVTILATPIPPVFTDASGYFRFVSVPEGDYEVRAEAGRCSEPLVQYLGVTGAIDNLAFALPQRVDAYGYYCSIEVVRYLGANHILPLSGDESAIQIDLPFPFSFYGQTYYTVSVSTNGLLSFLSPTTAFVNGPLPSEWEPNGAIYLFWDDLVVDEAASVRTELLGEAPNRLFVIEWREATFWGGSGRVGFEVVLYENGQILLQYTGIDADLREQGNSATIGIENENGWIAFQYAADEAVISEGLAIRFYPLPDRSSLYLPGIYFDIE